MLQSKPGNDACLRRKQTSLHVALPAKSIQLLDFLKKIEDTETKPKHAFNQSSPKG